MAGRDIMHFKEFTLRQEGCGMRISTDGVLLGSWATLHSKDMVSSMPSPLDPPMIIDVGTGTGLLTLMLAQRYPSAQLLGVEIEEKASQMARSNALASPFAERISIVRADFAKYVSMLPSHSANLIISNPPFFPSGVATRSQERKQARYTTTLAPRQLFGWASRLLKPNGKLAMITPYDQLEALRTAATSDGFVPFRLTAVVTVEGKAPKRLLSEWIYQHPEAPFCPLTSLTLRTQEGEYSSLSRQLLSPFYIFL